MRASLVGVCLLAAACRGPLAAIDATPPDVPAPFDAPDGTGCTATTPRSVAPEPFVGPDGLADRLAGLIDSAQVSLEVQMYLFSDVPLRGHVLAAHARGVHVRVLLDPGEAANGDTHAAFHTAGIEVRDAPPEFTYSHAKYLVIDDATGVIMSTNFNPDAMTGERNYGFVDRDPEDVADLQRIFTMDWATSGMQTPRPANLACTRLVVSPDNSKLRILALLDNAAHTIDVEAQYVSDGSVAAAITSAAARGVTVRVILEDPLQQTGNDVAAAQFSAAGIPVKYAKQFYVHAKLLLVDGVAFVGSENYSQTSLTANREVGGLLFEPAAAAVIQTQFDADWAATTPAS